MLLYVLFNISNLFLLACSCYFENKTYSTGADRWQERKRTVMLLVVYSCQNSSYFHVRVLMK